MLRPEKMSQMTISGHKKDLSDLSELLNDLNLVHLINYNNEDEGFSLGKSLNYGEESSEILIKLRSIIKSLDFSANPPSIPKLSSDVESEIGDLDSIIEEVNNLKDKQRETDRRIDESKAKYEAISEISDFDIDIKYLSGYNSVSVFVGSISESADLSDLANNPRIEVMRSDNNLIVFSTKDISDEVETQLLDSGFRAIEVPLGEGLPRVKLDSLESELNSLRNEKVAITQELSTIAIRRGDWLTACEEHYAALAEKSSLPLKLATSENMFVLDGWVPSDSISSLQQKLQGLDVYYEVNNNSKSDPPVKLDNPSFMKPFELFTKLYNTPRHWELDPTAIIFLTYPLFFGMMVGDAGYGFAYILFGHFIATKFVHTEALMNLGKILRLAGVWTFLFGTFIYAEAFGESFYHIGEVIGYNSFLFAEHYGPSFNVPLIEIVHEGDYSGDHSDAWYLPIHKFTPHGAQFMLLLSIIVGVIHISLAFILGFINEMKHHDLKHAIYAKLSFLLILWGGLFAIVSIVGLLPDSMMGVGVIILLIGLVLAVIGEGIVGLVEFPSVFSNVISYARIGAIGLSDYGLAFTINYIAFDMIGLEGINIIFAIAILLIGHLLVFTLGIVGTGINSLRLQYVEFFTKFVQGGGTAYSPFGYIRKYTKEKEVTP